MVTIRIKDGDIKQSVMLDKEVIDILISFDYKYVCVNDGKNQILSYEAKPPTT